MPSVSTPVPSFRKFKQVEAAGSNGALNFMDIMTAKTARDFALDMKPQTP
jgi:hypothetical protein